jgi:hypothetical protein
MDMTIRALVSVFLIICFGCATVSFLPNDESTTYEPTQSVKVYWEKPEEPYVVIGKVAAESVDFGEEVLFKKLKEKAMAAGAHAVIMGGASQESSVVGAPVYGCATVEPGRLEALAIRFTD